MPGKKKVVVDEKPPELHKRYEALNEAKKAAEDGDPIGMVTALFESYALDGLFLDLKRDHEELSHDDIDFIVGESVEALRKDIANGKKINSLLGYLWRIAKNKSIDLLRRRPPQSLIIDKPADNMERYLRQNMYDGAQREKNRNEAFKIARSMIQNLGGVNIIRVMEYSLDALEKNVELTTDDICEALDLSSDVVRACRSRGFKKLKRLFEEQNISVDDFGDDF